MGPQSISNVRVETTGGGLGPYERLGGEIADTFRSHAVEPRDQGDRPVRVVELQPCQSSIYACCSSELQRCNFRPFDRHGVAV